MLNLADYLVNSDVNLSLILSHKYPMILRVYLICVLVIASQYSICQISVSGPLLSETGVLFAPEYSKEITEYMVKEYISKELIKLPNEKMVPFYIEAVTASSSGELTSVVVSSDDMNLSGIILAFYGNYWNDKGISFKGYGFKFIPKDEAIKLFENLDEVFNATPKVITQKFFGKKGEIPTDIIYRSNDLIFIFYLTAEVRVRVLWEHFDSEWGQSNFNTTYRRFKKRLGIE